jgi:hypothetical protein
MTGNEPPPAIPPGPSPSESPPPDPAKPEGRGPSVRFSRASDTIPWSQEFLWPDGRGESTDEPAAARSWFPVLGVVLVLVFGMWLGLSRPGRSDPIQTEVLGRWTTATAPFAGRGFVVSREAIAFDQGGGELERYPVRRVVHRQEGALHRYRITYRAEEGDAQIELEHDPTARSLRILSRPSVIWRR